MNHCYVCGQEAPKGAGYCSEACYDLHMTLQAAQLARGERTCLQPYVPLQVSKIRVDVWPEKCSTCGRGYRESGWEICSNAFHCCRDCVWSNGRRVVVCERCKDDHVE